MLRRNATAASCPDCGGRLPLSDKQSCSIACSVGLSGRESQIVRCIFDDLNEVAIARELGISSPTVHTRLECLYRKLDVTSRCELIVRVFAEYLLLEPAYRGAGIGGPRRPSQATE